MLSAKDVAMYFISKDKDGCLFNTSCLIKRNDRKFYEGNARLNKYLHLAQNIYIAKTGIPLIDADFYAYDNGAVALEIQENYAMLLRQSKDADLRIFSADQLDFLDRFYHAFVNADIDELIQLSHEDSEWEDKQGYRRKADQKMDSMNYADEYSSQYADIIKVMERMTV